MLPTILNFSCDSSLNPSVIGDILIENYSHVLFALVSGIKDSFLSPQYTYKYRLSHLIILSVLFFVTEEQLITHHGPQVFLEIWKVSIQQCVQLCPMLLQK